MAATNDSATQSLLNLLTSTHTLLTHFARGLHPSTPAPTTAPTPITDAPNPLNVLSDSAKLVKANTTKLSLLAINNPFTPSAITTILRGLCSTCLPAMMSATQICEQEKAVWGEMMTREAKARVRRAMMELDGLVLEVQGVAEGNVRPPPGKSLRATGLVWESCDALIELAAGGVAGLAVKLAEQWRDTVKDAIEELREWVEGEDLETEGGRDTLLDSDDEGVDGDRDSLDGLFNAANSMPKDRPELKALVDQVEGRLKKVVILYNAIGKRRLKTFKGEAEGSIENVARLDELMIHLKRIPHQVDETASCFYDLDDEQVKLAMAKWTSEAKTACSVAGLSWEGKDDEFTSWSKKWQEAVG